MARRKPRPIIRVQPIGTEATGLLSEVEFEASVLGEFLRRVSLGLTAALIVTRAYWPGEYRLEADTGISLYWSLAILVTAMFGILGMWLSGGLKLRKSWADLGVISLFVLVAISASHAAERRIAINTAWEWIAVGVAYLLLRNLPRTRSESSALVGCLVATAVAVSAYGLYQITVELPGQRAAFQSNPRAVLIQLGIDPDSPGPQLQHLKDRLLGSREPTATFALANTLAGVLVGPAVIAVVMFLRGMGRREVWLSALLAAPMGLILLSVLLLTKSRSAYLGLLVAMLGLAWIELKRVPLKRILMGAMVLLLGSGVLVTVASFAGQLDKQVVTESIKSMRYRTEYWRGAWGVIWEGPSRWFVGLGPLNFAGPYLKHKLPQSSEEIVDPHNLVLDVWATAGLPAVVALLGGLVFGLRECFGRANLIPMSDESGLADKSRVPSSSLWLVFCAWIGGWLLAIPLGGLNPFERDPTARSLDLGMSMHWLMVGCAWIFTCFLGRSFWIRAGVTADAVGLGILAIVINLLAAGGIGYAPVSLMLWGLLALGQGLQIDRRSSIQREIGGRGLAFVPAAVMAAILGTFIGTVTPFWRAEAAIQEATAALTGARANPEKAASAYRRAVNADPFGSRGWINWANLEYNEFKRRKNEPNDLVWHRINSMLKQASKPPRNPDSLQVQRLRARWARDFLDLPDMIPAERYRIRTDRVNACGAACVLYPSDATLRADLAVALADLDRFGEAAEQGRKATKLDEATPHADRKLSNTMRTRLNELIPLWRSKAR